MAEQLGRDKDWEAIRKCLESQTNEERGEVFKEYVEESIHGGFDGLSSRDLTGIRRFLADYAIYVQNRGEG